MDVNPPKPRRAKTALLFIHHEWDFCMFAPFFCNFSRRSKVQQPKLIRPAVSAATVIVMVILSSLYVVMLGLLSTNTCLCLCTKPTN